MTTCLSLSGTPGRCHVFYPKGPYIDVEITDIKSYRTIELSSKAYRTIELTSKSYRTIELKVE